MTLPAPRRGRLLLIVAAAAALSCGPLAGIAQQPSAAPPPPAASAPKAAAAKTAEGSAAPKENPCKDVAGEKAGASLSAECKGAGSYSVGLLWGSQLRGTGVSSEGVTTSRIAQGIRDGLSGKALSPDDRENIRILTTAPLLANHNAAEKFLAANGKKAGVVTTASGLQYLELKAGSGASPKAADSVVVNYRGTLLNGTEFDASANHGGPATFEVAHLIPGWTEALQLMKPGAKWRLFVPPRLAYDLRSPSPMIPPGSMLVFDMELLSVKSAPPAAATPPTSASPAPVPQSALPRSTGKPPVNAPDNPNSPSPASVAPASK